jgi:hypothetical protein
VFQRLVFFCLHIPPLLCLLISSAASCSVIPLTASANSSIDFWPYLKLLNFNLRDSCVSVVPHVPHDSCTSTFKLLKVSATLVPSFVLTWPCIFVFITKFSNENFPASFKRSWYTSTQSESPSLRPSNFRSSPEVSVPCRS